MIAVIRTGGKQYTVAPEETHEIERIPGEAGATVEYTDVLMVDVRQPHGDFGVDALGGVGGGVSACALSVARQRSLRPELLDLRNSGDTAGDKLRVVGYGSFLFSEAAA